jgi:hypothetical protein
MLFEKVQLEETEKVLTVVRKHWFVVVSELFAIVVMAALPFISLLLGAVFLTDMIVSAFENPVLAQIIAFAIAAWLLVAFMTGFMIWTNYFLDVWIVTDRRIIYIDQLAFFNRNVSMFRLERLQDIEIKTVGILQTFLNFGTISAQTAGSNESNFISSGLPDPRGLQSIIQRAMDARLKKLHTTDTSALH